MAITKADGSEVCWMYVGPHAYGIPAFYWMEKLLVNNHPRSPVESGRFAFVLPFCVRSLCCRSLIGALMTSSISRSIAGLCFKHLFQAFVRIGPRVALASAMKWTYYEMTEEVLGPEIARLKERVGAEVTICSESEVSAAHPPGWERPCALNTHIQHNTYTYTHNTQHIHINTHSTHTAHTHTAHTYHTHTHTDSIALIHPGRSESEGGHLHDRL